MNWQYISITGIAILALCGVGAVVVYQNDQPGDPPEISEQFLQSRKIRDARRQALRPEQLKSTRELTAAQKRKYLRHGQKNNIKEMVVIIDQIEKGEFDHAEAMLLEQWLKSPSMAEIPMELAMLELFERKNKPKALSYLKKALTLAPNHQALQEETMQVFIDLGRYQEAIRFFTELTQASPDAKGYPYLLAKVYWAQHQIKVSLNYIERALAESKSNFKSYALRSKIYMKQGEWQYAKSDLIKAVEGFEAEIHQRLLKEVNVSLLTDELDRLMFLLADIHFKLQEYDDAYQVIAKLAERMPDDPRVAAMMDKLYQTQVFSHL